MKGVEYKVVPAPREAKRRRGAKNKAEALALAIQDLIAEQVAEGWDYVRADLIPCVERPGFLQRRIELHRAMLVFRKGAAAARPVEPAYHSARAEPRPGPVRTSPAAEDEPLELAGSETRSGNDRREADAPLPFRPLGSAND